MPFEYLEDLTAADVAFRAEGGSLEELFAAAWEATLGVIVDPRDLRPRVRRRIRLQDRGLEQLLYAFLEEQLYLKDAQGLLLRLETCRVDRRGGKWRVQAVAAGEPADPERHNLGTDVKAVTWHHFSLRREADRWQATVILDV